MSSYKLATDIFHEVIKLQLQRVEKMSNSKGFINYSELPYINIGIIPGDGIGPFITNEGKKVLEYILSDEIESGKIRLIDIQGLTLEERLKVRQAIPDKVLDKIRICPIILKGPTETPDSQSKINIESANVKIRKELDLFANVRPVKVDSMGIDWVFFRENTEGGYAVGNMGVSVNSDLSIDFTIATTQGTRRIIRAAFEYAKQNRRTKVTAVTKANVIKTTDGKFLTEFRNIAAEYPEISIDDWYIDIMTAKLLDEKRRRDFQVMVMPNLYGDILTDEAAEIQGGVGTCGSANIGFEYAMFEAIHGSAPRMVKEGRAKYADPRSILRAVAMLVSHIGFPNKASRLNNAMDYLDINFTITGRADGHSGDQYTELLIKNLG